MHLKSVPKASAKQSPLRAPKDRKSSPEEHRAKNCKQKNGSVPGLVEG
jgi:hypothetical protein